VVFRELQLIERIKRLWVQKSGEPFQDVEKAKKRIERRDVGGGGLWRRCLCGCWGGGGWVWGGGVGWVLVGGSGLV